MAFTPSTPPLQHLIRTVTHDTCYDGDFPWQLVLSSKWVNYCSMNLQSPSYIAMFAHARTQLYIWTRDRSSRRRALVVCECRSKTKDRVFAPVTRTQLHPKIRKNKCQQQQPTNTRINSLIVMFTEKNKCKAECHAHRTGVTSHFRKYSCGKWKKISKTICTRN